MNPIFATMTTLAVSTIYIVWQNYHGLMEKRERVLRSRITYMLWCAANNQG